MHKIIHCNNKNNANIIIIIIKEKKDFDILNVQRAQMDVHVSILLALWCKCSLHCSNQYVGN